MIPCYCTNNYREVANDMMEGSCGLEELVIASREISSSTIQLVSETFTFD